MPGLVAVGESGIKAGGLKLSERVFECNQLEAIIVQCAVRQAMGRNRIPLDDVVDTYDVSARRERDKARVDSNQPPFCFAWDKQRIDLSPLTSQTS